jgi:tRNA-uridine 2-sulfurtransferase
MKEKKKKVIVAISGGVDSSVAALLMKEKGYAVMGVFMHFWKEETGGKIGEFENKCCSDAALFDARRVCRRLDIPFYAINFHDDFKNKIVDYFISEYASGQTPNPCIVCNQKIKIGGLIKKAKALGYDSVATGHYAGVKEKAGQYRLFKAKDEDKDQSYFLYRLGQEELSHLLLPLHGLKKSEVRKIAEKRGLPTAHKRESQEVCFIPEKSHNDFLKRHLKLVPGDIKTLDGKIIGRHQGLPLYTVGQRKGVEIGGTGPYYVVSADYETNSLYVVSQQNDAALFKKEFYIKDANWIGSKKIKFPFKCEAVIRYHHEPVKCEVGKTSENIYIVKLSKPARAVTPGQSAVFYSKNEVIGGGVINI